MVRDSGGREDVHFGRMNHEYGELHLKQDSNNVWAENRGLGVIHKAVVVVESVGIAESSQASGGRKRNLRRRRRHSEMEIKIGC